MINPKIGVILSYFAALKNGVQTPENTTELKELRCSST